MTRCASNGDFSLSPHPSCKETNGMGKHLLCVLMNCTYHRPPKGGGGGNLPPQWHPPNQIPRGMSLESVHAPVHSLLHSYMFPPPQISLLMDLLRITLPMVQCTPTHLVEEGRGMLRPLLETYHTAWLHLVTIAARCCPSPQQRTFQECKDPRFRDPYIILRQGGRILCPLTTLLPNSKSV